MKRSLSLFLAVLLLLSCLSALADEDAVSGASQVVQEETQLPQEDIRNLALEYLHGFPLSAPDAEEKIWSYREMYQIATVHGDMPGLSSVEFVLDPETMRLYASSERDTEKIRDIEKNGNVVMYWYHQIPEAEYVPQQNDYFNSYGVQIRGKARLMTTEDEHFTRIANMYLRTLFGTAMWDALDQDTKSERIAQLGKVNAWIEVMPEEYVVTSLFWVYNKEGSRRPQYYDPASPYFGKAPRQVYHVPQTQP